MEIRQITHHDTIDFIMKKHYAQRMPSISMAFWLFINNSLEWVLTIWKPASNSLCEWVCGKDYKDIVFELNRLIVNEWMPKNTLSKFVWWVMRQIKEKDLIIVSYSDTWMWHHGYIYQATNFIYTGITKERTDKYTPDWKHSRHYTEEYNHLRKVRTAKHRYVFFTGKSRKKFMKELKYPVISTYPKWDNERYTLWERMKTKIIDTKNNLSFYE